MPRKNRIIYEGAIYHIYQRGNNKEYIFEDDKIKMFILKYLKIYNQKFDYEILAYVIMNNHYHLLIKTNTSPIDEIMFNFNNVLGKYVNSILNRTGHAFEDRYKCKLVYTNTYLIWLLRYIHRNPVKAHICNNANEYRWSSHYIYENNNGSFINSAFILNMLGNDKKSAIEQYHNLINFNGDEKNIEKDYEITKAIFIIKERYLLNEKIIESNFIEHKRKSLDEIVKEFNIKQNTLVEIRSGKRNKHLTSIKLMIVKKAIEENYSLKEISIYLNVVPSAISKLLSRSI